MFSFLAILLGFMGTPSALPTPQSLPLIVLHAPKATLHVQVAETEDERERGLMSVTKLSPQTGMLFIFDHDGAVAFWMKDTLIPLDMVFLSPDGTVRKVFANVRVVSPKLPDDKIPIEQAQAAYVIELPANEAARDGLAAGTHVGNLPPAR
jgi:uncharacterized protein